MAKQPQTPPSNNPFFMQQGISTAPPAAKSVVESPILQTPQSKSKGATGTSSTQSKSKKPLFIGLTVILFLLLIGGTGFFLFSSQEGTPDTVTEQEIADTSARLNITPATTSFPAGSDQNLQLDISIDELQTPINSMELVVDITGTIPQDLELVANNIPGFTNTPAQVSQTTNGRQFKLTFTPENENGTPLSSSPQNVATIRFTTPPNGQLNVRFNPTLSKIAVGTNNQDILRPPTLIVYTFVPSETQVVVASESAQSLGDAMIASQAAFPSPTIRVAGIPASGGAGVTATPSATASPTKTPTPKPTVTTLIASTSATPIATATSTRDTSVPAQTQETPVSGNGLLTFLLFFTGVVSIMGGAQLWQQALIAEQKEANGQKTSQ